MQLVFNELSLSENVISKQRLDTVFRVFLETYSSILREYPFVSRGIFTSVDINSIELYPGYYLSQWRNSKDIDRDEKRRLLGLCERQNIAVPSNDSYVYIEYNGKSGKGFQIAYEQENPILSFTFSDEWNSSPILCDAHDLEKEESKKIELVNFHDPNQAKDYKEYFCAKQSQELEQIQTPSDFLLSYKELFPSLIFHENALNQIKSQIAPATIPILVEKLMKMEKYFFEWNGEGFDTEAFPPRFISPESTETLKRFKSEHTYKWNGQDILVSYHIRYTGADVPGRIYIYPEHTAKKGIVCSLHTKLPTVSEPKFTK